MQAATGLVAWPTTFTWDELKPNEQSWLRAEALPDAHAIASALLSSEPIRDAIEAAEWTITTAGLELRLDLSGGDVAILISNPREVQVTLTRAGEAHPPKWFITRTPAEHGEQIADWLGPLVD